MLLTIRTYRHLPSSTVPTSFDLIRRGREGGGRKSESLPTHSFGDDGKRNRTENTPSTPLPFFEGRHMPRSGNCNRQQAAQKRRQNVSAGISSKAQRATANNSKQRAHERGERKCTRTFSSHSPAAACKRGLSAKYVTSLGAHTVFSGSCKPSCTTGSKGTDGGGGHGTTK